jgi:phage shock protein A
MPSKNKYSSHLCNTLKTVARYSFLTLLLFIFFSGKTFSQKSDVDSLRRLIANETNDTSKIKLLIQFGIRIAESEAEQDSCFMEVFELSKKNNFQYGLVFGEYHQGLLLARVGKYDEAIEKYKKCIDGLDILNIIQHTDGFPLWDIRSLFNSAGKQEAKFLYYSDKIIYYKRFGPIENTANCFHGIAGYYWYLADYDKAIEYYFRAREVYQSFDSFGYANENQVIGRMYMEWGNLDKAEVFLKSALKDLISLKKNCFYSYHQLGDLNLKKHEYNQALSYYFEGKKYVSTPVMQAMHFVNCAAAHLELNSKDSARFYLDGAEKIRQKEKLGIAYTNGNVEVDYTFYKYYSATGNNQLAAQHLETALQDARIERYLPLILKYTNELHSFLLETGDSIQSLRYLVQYQTLQDSLNKMSTRARIASYEIEQQQQQQETEIAQLQSQKATQRNYYLIGGAFLVLVVLAAFSRFRYKRKRDEEQLTTDFKKQLAQAETKALRSQMNPHFIFNCLNSINSMVMEEKHEIASDYLIKFSKLIRLILDNSRSETITIEKELETLKLYVTLESARFDNKFRCIFDVAENVNTSSIMIPPMLLQPFIENAIWHGLMQKETEGTITIEIKMEGEETLKISITDDGIGREKAAELKSKSATHKSHGLKVTSQRIEMMNKLNSTGAQVNIFDLKDEQGSATGTKVELIIPV